MGGVNYFRNLFEALRLPASPQIEPVVYAGPSADQTILNSLGAAEVHITPWADSLGWRWKLRRSLALGVGRDSVFERELRRERISLYSHMGYLGKRSSIPSLTWIPDFQERYLPEFFSPAELDARKRECARTVRQASALLLSSQHAREGLAGISLEAATNAYVLPFVASVPKLSDIPSRVELEQKYRLPQNYFFLPNQFWTHKNHEVVIRALGLLRRRGIPLAVVATGNLQDHRQPTHGQRLMRMIAEEKVESDFVVLGMVPYLDLMGLMAHSVAVLNPSLFEGWSTTVEEAKSLGKIAIISDIPVHCEQALERAYLFDPREPEALVATMLNVVQAHCIEEDAHCMKRAELALPARRQAFAASYEQIVSAVIGGQ